MSFIFSWIEDSQSQSKQHKRNIIDWVDSNSTNHQITLYKKLPYCKLVYMSLMYANTETRRIIALLSWYALLIYRDYDLLLTLQEHLYSWPLTVYLTDEHYSPWLNWSVIDSVTTEFHPAILFASVPYVSQCGDLVYDLLLSLSTGIFHLEKNVSFVFYIYMYSIS